LAWNGNLFVLTGYTGGNGGVKVFTSTDGTSWMDRSSGAGVASWQDLRKVAWLNDRWVSSGWYSSLRTSTDGAQTFTTTRSQTEENPAMAYGNGIYFTAGVNRSNSSADVDVLSLDGVTWYSFAAPTTTDRNAAVFFKNAFLTAGDSGTLWQSGTVAASDPFLVWQASQFPGGGAASLAESDPDLDGLSNLTEFALGRNPNSGSGSEGASAAGVLVWQSGRPWLQLDLPYPTPSNLTYTVQGAPNPDGQWTNIAQKSGNGSWTWVWANGGTARLNVGAPSSGRMSVAAGAPDDVLGATKYFFRLQVSLP
jgi:hypothetical protein